MLAYQTAEGCVSDFIARYLKEAPACTWAQLKAELTVRFAEITDPSHAMVALRKVKQKDESVQVYAERLLALATEAWPEANMADVHIEGQMIELFVNGLRDDTIARKVIREDPKKYTEAVKCAITEQNLCKRYELRNRGYHPPQVTPMRGTGARDEEPMEIQRFSGHCHRCGKKGHVAARCKTHMPAIKQVQSQSPQAAPLVCWGCGRQGHCKYECDKTICYRCSRPGHVARKCPN